ncbi:MAG: pyridoxamine 5'-phosphate oxidase family protein [Bulleidia sp.]|nr:pyridoxamine 5'-phosphate oxidase family protein [Bulleidia sp.]
MEWRKMRRFKQEISEAECLEVLKESPRGVLSMFGENGYPYGIPLDFYYDAQDGKIYFHGAKEGNKLDLLQKDNHVCFTVMDQGCRKEGDWALYIRSVVIFGRIEKVEDPDKAFQETVKIGRKYYPPEEDMEAYARKYEKALTILCLSIDHMSGKLVHEK